MPPTVWRLRSHWGQLHTGRGWDYRTVGANSTSVSLDERCKWKLLSWRYNQTPATHVNVDCQDSQPLLPWELTGMINMLWAPQKSQWLLPQAVTLLKAPMKCLGKWWDYGEWEPSPATLPPGLFGWPEHPACSAGGGRCWLELNAIHSPDSLTNCFPKPLFSCVWLRSTLSC